MKTKVIFQSSAGCFKEYKDADGIDYRDGKIFIYKGKKLVAIDGPMRRGDCDPMAKCAYIVREKKKRWKLKLVKE